MIQPFSTFSGVAAPLDRVNIDTDAIIPARFMKTVKRSGLGAHLFDSWRYSPDGTERPDFVLNQPAFRHARILVVNDNFGCGSSREHAVWALTDFGIRSIVAPSFAEIFYNNALKNGLLPITLPQTAVKALLQRLSASPGSMLTIDLQAQVVTSDDHDSQRFEMNASDRQRLLLGLDDIGMTLQRECAITQHEITQKRLTPWLFKDL